MVAPSQMREGVTWPSVCDTHAGAGARRQQHFEQVTDGGVAALTPEHADDHLKCVDDHLQCGSVDSPLGARPWLRPGDRKSTRLNSSHPV